ncbi:hypothetical protein NL676_014225 [Syzygium grande]|nr:hypothetical protein NL676_014225 [Syzygium grande]
MNNGSGSVDGGLFTLIWRRRHGRWRSSGWRRGGPGMRDEAEVAEGSCSVFRIHFLYMSNVFQFSLGT